MSIAKKMLQQQRIFSLMEFILGGLALLIPFWRDGSIVSGVGGLLLWGALLEIYQGFRLALYADRKSAWLNGAYTLLLAILLINEALWMSTALLILIAGTFILNGVGQFILIWQRKKDSSFSAYEWVIVIGNLLMAVLIFIFRERGIAWTIPIAGSLRLIGTGISMLARKPGLLDEVSEDIVREMGVAQDSEVSRIANQLEEDQRIRAPFDKYWIIIFILVLFFIHLGRMGFDRSRFGILSPAFATVGDIFIALVVAFGIIAPIRYGLRKFSGLFERASWAWVMKVPPSERKRWGLRSLVQWWLETRLDLTISLRKSGYSLKTALRNGLKIGLPWAALLAAVMPVLGMSWYFDTENWASGIWDSWAAGRVTVWREVIAQSNHKNINSASFNLRTEGVDDSSDFSFIVIGDPGEGDASQLVLKDQLQRVAENEGVKFVVISSDVVYPSGEMKDYEKNFFLPFKGIRKPIYAIPGNHDWYDALEGFSAVFFDSTSARSSMLARVDADNKMTLTNERKIGKLIRKAEQLRNDYQVPTGFQQAPYFQVSVGDFVLITVDTGVKRDVDSVQLQWLRDVLEKSKGKFVMVVLGHPFYAIGEYQGSLNPDFEELHRLLRKYKVPLVMAGDTHDLEYYREAGKDGDTHVMHHFVNGGGGAYLSIGAAFAKDEKIPLREYAFYPSRKPLEEKIEANNSMLKKPAWWWTKEKDGWPFSAEWLSAAFDYNVAPFFQSFMEIRVERSKNQLRLIPYGVHGQLKWDDFQRSEIFNQSRSGEKKAEWVLPLR
jgi:3',5'-cyclic AMP phosphodiesterase CpdA